MKLRSNTSSALPTCISANDPTTAWHGMENSRSFDTAALPPGKRHGPLLCERLTGINSKIVLFADDTGTIMTISNQEELKTVLFKTLSDKFMV